MWSIVHHIPHRDLKTLAPFVVLSTANGTALTLSDTHIVYVADEPSEARVPAAARDVKVCTLTLHGCLATRQCVCIEPCEHHARPSQYVPSVARRVAIPSRVCFGVCGNLCHLNVLCYISLQVGDAVWSQPGRDAHHGRAPRRAARLRQRAHPARCALACPCCHAASDFAAAPALSRDPRPSCHPANDVEAAPCTRCDWKHMLTCSSSARPCLSSEPSLCRPQPQLHPTPLQKSTH